MKQFIIGAAAGLAISIPCGYFLPWPALVISIIIAGVFLALLREYWLFIPLVVMCFFVYYFVRDPAVMEQFMAPKKSGGANE